MHKTSSNEKNNNYDVTNEQYFHTNTPQDTVENDEKKKPRFATHHADNTLINNNVSINIEEHIAKSNTVNFLLYDLNNNDYELIDTVENKGKIVENIFLVSVHDQNSNTGVIIDSYFKYNSEMRLIESNTIKSLIINEKEESGNDYFTIVEKTENKFHANGKKSSITQEKFNTKGELLHRTETCYNIEGYEVSLHKYDKNNKLISRSEFKYTDYFGHKPDSSEGWSKRIEYIYNNKDELISKIITNDTGDIVEKTRFEYKYEKYLDSSVFSCTQSELTLEGVLRQSKKLFYNTNNQVIRTIVTLGKNEQLYNESMFKYDNNGELTNKLVSIFDNENRERTRIVTDGNGLLISKTQLYYANNRIRLITKVNKDKQLISKIKYEYSDPDGETGSVFEESNEYYDDHNVYKESSSIFSNNKDNKLVYRKETIEKFDEDGVTEITESFYNSNNLLTSTKVTDAYDQLISKSEFKYDYDYDYDKNGHFSSRTESIFDSDDNIVDKRITNTKGENILIPGHSTIKENDYDDLDRLMDVTSSFTADKNTDVSDINHYRDIQYNNILTPYLNIS